MGKIEGGSRFIHFVMFSSLHIIIQGGGWLKYYIIWLIFFVWRTLVCDSVMIIIGTWAKHGNVLGREGGNNDRKGWGCSQVMDRSPISLLSFPFFSLIFSFPFFLSFHFSHGNQGEGKLGYNVSHVQLTP